MFLDGNTASHTVFGYQNSSFWCTIILKHTAINYIELCSFFFVTTGPSSTAAISSLQEEATGFMVNSVFMCFIFLTSTPWSHLLSILTSRYCM